MSTISGYPPGGLSALSSFMKSKGIETKLYDLNIELFHQLIDDWETNSRTIGESMADRITGTMQTKLRRDELSYFLRVIIPLIDRYRGEKRSPILHRYLEELLNVFLFDDLLMRKNEHCHLRASLSEVLDVVQVRKEDPTLNRLLDRHPWGDSDLVGFSLISEQQFPYTILIAQMIRERSPGAKFILGGPYITEMAGQLMHDPRLFDYIDYIVVNEGETALLGIIKHERDDFPLTDPNVICRTTADGPRPHIHLEDVRVFDEQCFTEFDLSLYECFPERGLPVYSSKGCTWCRCAFCSHDQIMNYREMEVPRFVDKVSKLVEQTSITRIQLSDEDVRPDRLRDMADELNRRSMNIEWSIQTRFYPTLSGELLKKLLASGCRTIEFGLESASLGTLKRIDKGISLKTVRRVLADCEAAGMSVILNCMVGFPFETEEDAEELVRFVDDMRKELPELAFMCNTQLVKVYKNSDFGRRPQDFGIGEIRGYDLSPIMDWDRPHWIDAFITKQEGHLLFTQKWARPSTRTPIAPGNEPGAMNDPVITLTDDWAFIRKEEGGAWEGSEMGTMDELVRVGVNRLQVYGTSDTMSELVGIICREEPKLSELKEMFFAAYPDHDPDEKTRILYDGIMALNEKGAISFHER
jgi:radical SAM superfamily enzyme YgiQ (UPF0313 family)